MDKRQEILRGGLNALIGRADLKEREGTASYPIEEERIEMGTPQEEDELLASIEDDGLRAALEKRRNERRGRPKRGEVRTGKQEDVFVRFCTLVRRDQIAKMKEICFLETLTMKELFEATFKAVIESYEEEHGEICPKDHHKDASSIFKGKISIVK